MGIKATLGGVPLTLGSGQVWTLGYGVQPHQRTFVMTRSRAQKVLAISGPIELVVAPAGYPTLRVKNLYALHAVAVDENNMGVVVVDVRWKFSRKSVVRDYNIRRRTGDKRRVGVFLQPIQVKDIIGDVVYRRATLNNGARWDAREVLEDILSELVGVGGFSVGETQFTSEIEDLVLDRDRGDSENSRSVEGVVLAPSGDLVEGAVVQLKDTKTLRIRSYITLEGGQYNFHGLSTETDYELQAKHEERTSRTRRLTVYDSRKKANMDLRLEEPES